MLTFGSLFAGIGGFDSGFEAAGLRCSWQVEKDKDCLRVLAHHWPDVLRVDDVCKAGMHNLTPVDVITFGSPCQDLSVAGKRGGLHGSRSGLFFEAIRIVSELRPALAIWENVPGAFSSHAGRDFLSALNAFHELGATDLAWRTLDAQYFGLAQRRERVFLVADFGKGERAAQILFESPCGCGHPPKGGKAREDVAATIRSRSHGAGVNPPGRGGEDDHNLVFSELGEGHQTYQEAEVATGLRTGHGGGDKKANLVVGALQAHAKRHGHAMTTQQAAESGHLVAATLNSGGNDGGFRTEPGEHLVAHALRSVGADASEDGTGRGTPIVTVRTNQTGSNGTPAGKDLSPPLDSSEPVAVAFQCHGNNVGPMGTLRAGNGNEAGGVPFVPVHGDTAFCLPASSRGTGDGHGQGWNSNYLAGGMTVRRLTPVECCRLQGFPDDWLDLLPPLSDSAKYRLLGNAVAVPVASFIGRQLLAAL